MGLQGRFFSAHFFILYLFFRGIIRHVYYPKPQTARAFRIIAILRRFSG
jgi:hypothetical protein